MNCRCLAHEKKKYGKSCEMCINVSTNAWILKSLKKSEYIQKAKQDEIWKNEVETSQGSLRNKNDSNSRAFASKEKSFA